MMRTVDLFTIASSGVNASNKLLQTTSNNIANVNTEGYVRERTTLANGLLGGVGEATTERVINTFAQNQMRRDITQVGEWETYYEKSQAIDNLLASEANSLSTGLSDFFASLQTAADDPTDLASRNLVLSEGQGILRRMNTMSTYLESLEEQTNREFDSMVNKANELIKSIGTLNQSILVAQQGEEPTTLLNERDKAINELAEFMAIDIRESSTGTGTVTVSLSTGEALVLDDGSFNVMAMTGEADASDRQLTLKTNFNGNKQDTEIFVDEARVGGALGGLFSFRDDVLGPTQRDIGQLAVSFADAVNEQNSLGMDLDFQIGGDIFTLPEFEAANYNDNTATGGVTGRITAGDGDVLSDADIRVTVATINGAGQPTSLTVSQVNSDGTIRKDPDGNDLTTTMAYSPGAGFTSTDIGIDIDIDTSVAYAVGDAFLFQPLKSIASDITMATNRAEDLAFASPVRAEAELSNDGSAYVSGTSVSNTTVSTGADGSAFDGAQGIHDNTNSPNSPATGAPAMVVFTSANDYELQDAAGNTIASVTGATSLNNLIAQAKQDPSWPANFSAPTATDYPGYDVSLEGIPAAGDTFNLVYNTNGVSDNTNAVAMADLQDAGTVQLSDNSSTQLRTFHEAYSSMVSRVGEDTNDSDIALQAAQAMQEQSETWFDSVSGVSLDEEAANLVRFQQSYAASARILSAAQELFDTILAAAR